MNSPVVVVCGLGEVGKPLMQILSRTYDCVGVDIEPVELRQPCSVLHVCYPFQIPDFVGETLAYARKYRPGIIVVNSTVAPGTTRSIGDETGVTVAYSPVRGKHARMEKDMLSYRKFVGADDVATAGRVVEHFKKAGFKTDQFHSTIAGEVAKLIETTWLGMLVGWAQEIERIAQVYGSTYSELDKFVQEIAYLPHGIFPGFIGGHCVMPNIAILQTQVQSDFLDAVVNSNRRKAEGQPTAAVLAGSAR